MNAVVTFNSGFPLLSSYYELLKCAKRPTTFILFYPFEHPVRYYLLKIL